MIDVATVVTASVVCLAGVMSPGPNFVAVTHRAVTKSRAEVLPLVLGIASVSALWATAAVFGLGILFSLFPWLFWSVKLLGAAYLAWLGLQLIRGARLALAEQSATVTRSTFLRAFRDGVVTNLSNPKSMAFYASVFSASVPAAASSATLAAVVLMVPAIATCWYGGVALFLSSANAATCYRKGKPLIERVCGALLIVFGLRQAIFR